MSHEGFYGARGFIPGGWHPYSGTSNEAPAPDSSGGGGGEFYEYFFRSGPGSHPRPRPPAPADSAEPSRLTEETRRLTAEASRVTAEATRLQAEVTRLAAENAELRQKVESGIDEEAARKARVIARVLPLQQVSGGTGQVMLINERVGSVSLDFWVAMSESGKTELDTVLKGIVTSICGGKDGWENIGSIIRTRLGSFGILLTSKEEFTAAQKGTWTEVNNSCLPDSKRVSVLLDFSGQDASRHSYAHETIRFLGRLIELRHGN